MQRFPGLRRVLRLAPLGRDVDGEVDDELALHLDLKVAELMREGWSEAEARAEARRRFGDYEGIRREVAEIAGRRRRKVERMERMGRWRQDLRYGIRQIGRHPGFAAVAVLTLALGIGATTAIFSVVSGVLLRSLPFADAERLVRVWVDPTNSMSEPDFVDVRDEGAAIEALAGYSTSDVTLTGDGEPSLLTSAQVSEGLLSIFQVTPVLGRDLREDEHGANAAPVAVISYGTWQQLFAGASDVLGRTLVINGVTTEIVGVAPEGFEFPRTVQIWMPRQINPDGCGRGCHTWVTVGRLAEGATIQQAQAEADRLASALASEFPDSNTDKRFAIVSLQDDMVGDVRAGLWVVLASVIAVLLIACANVANLLLVRATARTGEMAVRGALGASRGRLATQMLVESGLLAAAGGALGLLLACGGVGALRGLSSGTIPRIEDVRVDGPVLLFALAIVVVVTLLVGLVPALRSSESAPAADLAHAGRGRSGSARQGPRRLLVALEVGLSVVLLIAAGLMLRTFNQMYQV
ncbi:MAG: ABC transporter permease, partial [Gemmatimonadetes bacterium]|nr:ABC transporter permease [Gemmatimonadota bacterium]